MIKQTLSCSLLIANICVLTALASEHVGPMDDVINPSAVKEVLGRVTSNVIDKDGFARCLNTIRGISLYTMMDCCVRHTDKSLTESDKMSMCEDLVRQIVSVHNDMIENDYTVNGGRTTEYSVNKQHVIKETDYYGLDPKYNYGVFSAKDNEFQCFLNCSNKNAPSNPCTKDGSTIFFCNTPEYGAAWYLKFLVGTKVQSGANGLMTVKYKTGDRDNASKQTGLTNVETYDQQMERYQSFVDGVNQQRTVGDSDMDFLNCSEYLQTLSPLTAKEYDYTVPAPEYYKMIESHNNILKKLPQSMNAMKEMQNDDDQVSWRKMDFYAQCSKIQTLRNNINISEDTYARVENTVSNYIANPVYIETSEHNEDVIQMVVDDINKNITYYNPMADKMARDDTYLETGNLMPKDYHFGYTLLTVSDCRQSTVWPQHAEIGHPTFYAEKIQKNTDVSCTLHNTQLNKTIKVNYIIKSPFD